MYTVGIDVGSVSINCIVLDRDKHVVCELPYRRHFGRIVPCVLELFSRLYEQFPPEQIRAVAMTGNHGKIIAERLAIPYEYDSVTQILGVLHLVPNAATVITMGGQDAALYRLSRNNGTWSLRSFAMNGPCAAGTGSFIDQQAERLASSLYEEKVAFSEERIAQILADFIAIGKKCTSPAPVACRCTVFTKSDMIHLQNKGESLPNIIAGLHQGNAANYVSTIVASQTLKEPVVFSGGVATNDLQVEAFRRYCPGLVVPPYHTSIGALGAALLVHDRKKGPGPDLDALRTGAAGEFPRAPRLTLRRTTFTDHGVIARPGRISPRGLEVYLGVDIGSTTTKTVLMDGERSIVHKQYVPTQGKPIEVAQRLLAGIREEFGDRLAFLGVATTGSGRHVVGDFLKADLVVDEITAHARAAVHWDPEVDTVFEIGGQDSKYIWIERRNPLDFDMNKVCAAGTGSFLHELANKLRINIVKEFQEIALSATNPVNLAERCTVFMESDLVSYAQKGAHLEDLIAGLCYAVVSNYLNRVVGKRRIGNRVMFLGGPSLNRGIVAAFENVLQQEILIPANREVLGAHGAALLAREKRLAGAMATSSFPGLHAVTNAPITFAEKVCQADRNCHNECKLKVYDFGGRKSIWGGDCGRYEMRSKVEEREENWFTRYDRIAGHYLEGKFINLEELAVGTDKCLHGKPTIGIPRALHFLNHTVLWTHFWTRLGYPVVLSSRTNQQIARAGIESMTSETCYPIKVFHGHVKTLLGATRYLFLPAVINMPTSRPEEAGFYCPLVQGSQYMVRAALNIPETEILAPTVYLKASIGDTVRDLSRSLGRPLGLGRGEIDRAFREAWELQLDFIRTLRGEGLRFLESLRPGDLWVAVSGRPYNLYDERLNLRLGQNLAKLGIRAIPHDFLDTDGIDLSDFPDMYWGLGARILRTAKLVRKTPGCYGLHLTNFSCGADSFLEHFYRHLMGEKPYLILELDEHSAVAGMVTRLEAYRNVIQNDHCQSRPSPDCIRPRERVTECLPLAGHVREGR
jgi:predicted CoA-substrate-specific enzyme activase